jgi:hypothetical protein
VKYSGAIKIIAVLASLILLANCSEDDSVCPVPGHIPGVSGIYPQDGAVDVPTDTFLTVVFDKKMDPAGISAGAFTLEGPRGAVSATVAFDGNRTVTLTPRERLAGHSVFTARIDAGVRDTEGQAMGVPYAWSFTTGTTSLWIYPDVEFTIRDDNGDGSPDSLVGGGPPGRFLQTGVEGLVADRAVIEFPLDEIVNDEVIYAAAFIDISAVTGPSGMARIESWGFIGNGTGELTDWDNGSRTAGYDDIEMMAGQTISLPIVDVLNAALAAGATHVGLRVVVTGDPVVGIETSVTAPDDEKPRIMVQY